jgi:hypothetical protein
MPLHFGDLEGTLFYFAILFMIFFKTPSNFKSTNLNMAENSIFIAQIKMSGEYFYFCWRELTIHWYSFLQSGTRVQVRPAFLLFNYWAQLEIDKLYPFMYNKII